TNNATTATIIPNCLFRFFIIFIPDKQVLKISTIFYPTICFAIGYNHPQQSNIMYFYVIPQTLPVGDRTAKKLYLNHKD
ncbi:MAG: hypothetical protein OSA92_09610, partial [Pirellulaceae bacterium]|nr:hypothetical protein [Pirellulaceae bacterium]